MPKNKPLITIITPSYMQGAFINDCILSVKNQTYKNLEHIILDSCSTDQTEKVIKKHLGTYPLTYKREKDKGQANAINKGLKMAKGDVVCWLNSDDFFIDPSVLGKIAGLFKTLPGIDVVTGDGYFVDKDKKCLAPIVLEKPKYMTHKYMRYADYILQPSTFWRKNSIRLDESLNYAFDWKFFMDFYKNGLSFYYSRDYYSCYRVHGDSKTFTDTARRKKEIMKLLKYNKAPFPSRFWAFLVYLGYLISEKTGLKFIRKITFFLNQAMKKLSDGRIYSC